MAKAFFATANKRECKGLMLVHHDKGFFSIENPIVLQIEIILHCGEGLLRSGELVRMPNLGLFAMAKVCFVATNQNDGSFKICKPENFLTSYSCC